MLLAGGAEPNAAQVEGLLENAIESCERYYQAFSSSSGPASPPRKRLIP